MSQSFLRGSSSRKATTCPNCRRTVVIHELDDGTSATTDTELIGAVVKVAAPGKRTSRTRREVYRVHAEQCDRYKLEDEKREWAKAAKKAKRTGTLLADPSFAVPASTAAPAPKFDSLAAARKSVLGHYATVARSRRR